VETRVVNQAGELVDSVDAFKVNLKKEQAKELSEWNLPIFVGKLEDGSTKYIIPLYGKGLWGPIWGYIALNDDMNTIYGASFDHKSETPGLGSEINTAPFMDQFKAKQIMNSDQEFVSVLVVKGGAQDGDPNAVDAISGGTITSKGLEKMVYTCMEPYMNYFKSQLTEGGE
jgi:Na+-transporting NADH:ubiquinone oxidoreductase subunit C